MSIYWPPTLPQEQFLGFSFEEADSRVQTPMELGPPKMRPRSLLNIATAAPEAVFTGAQVAIFRTFWVTTLRAGTQRFVWTHPVTDVAVEMSFAKRPAFTPISGNADPTQRLWRTTLPLRIHT